MGSEGQLLESDGPITVEEVWRQVSDNAPQENLLCSRNLQYVQWDEAIEDGDEIAFFPPVTGG